LGVAKVFSYHRSGVGSTRKTQRPAAMTAEPEFRAARRASGKGQAFVMVIYGPELGRRAPVGRSAFEIGRSTKSDLPIDQESVSRHHARITYAQGTHFIEDLGSTNGTFVSDARVTAKQPLRHGDQLKVGRSILKYMAGDDVETNYHEEIYRLMTVDALTQTYNKRYFTEALEREYNRSTRYKRDLSIVTFDVDEFKKINAEYGHLSGDAVLRHIAQSIKTRLRAQDIFARIGGEEFGVLLPEVGLLGARVTAEKVRKIIEASAAVHEGKAIPCTVSLGIATLTEDKKSGEALLAAADTRLREAKRAGRNRVAG
jgi:diguanylate cyclase (GGDEF)-like protein